MSRANVTCLMKRVFTNKYDLQNFKNYCVSSEHNKARQKDLAARQKEIMSRGLPIQKPILGVKQILLVASGKGGVGKTTTAVNLSTALKIIDPTKSVGLLDTDIFGPSIPLMMNLHQTPMLNNENLMEPLVNYGIKCMSMGFLVDEKSPVIWRGLMVMSALERLLRQVAWSPVDYLIVDTPPGTGDTHLSLIQNLPIAGVLLITTSQKAALDVTRRGAVMFQKLKVPVVGIIENMANITCPKCMHKIEFFGNETTALAQELGLKVLQRIPLDKEITDSCDIGKPIVLSAPENPQAIAYKDLAKNVTEFLQNQPVNTD